MYCAGRVRLGLTYEYFWNLTWYEWGFECLKIHELDIQKEFQMDMAGRIMAIIAEVHRDPKQNPVAFKRSDFFKLSYDTQAMPEDGTAIFKEAIKRLGSKIKRTDSGDN